MIFINPKTDFAFKKIFGSEESKPVLIDFLNALLYQAQPTIVDLEILDPYQAPRIAGIKDTYLDVKAQLANDTTVIIEMQVLNLEGFEKRILYNAAKAFSIQLSVGEDYKLLNPVIALTITDFKMFEGGTKVISRYVLKERESLTNYSEDIELVFAELPKFTKTLPELETVAEKWLYFLKHARSLQDIPSNLKAVPALERAFELANQAALTPAELEVLEKREMFLHDSRNAILKASKDGEKRGIQKGLEQGRQEGRQEGRQAGRQERAVEIARKLIGVLELETISQTTGLSLSELQALQKF